MAGMILVTAAGFRKELTPSEQVKYKFRQNCSELIRLTSQLKDAAQKGKARDIREKFIEARLAYKKMETIVEYFYEFHATKLNGPPFIFYKEDEPDVMWNEPYGFQMLEGLIFSKFNAREIDKIKLYADELARYAVELANMNETFEFSDASIFDAFMESMYRVTVTGLTGLDAPLSGNALSETAAVLEGLSDYLACFSKNFNDHLPGKHDQTKTLLAEGSRLLRKETNFNRFNRMEFILTYLDPVTKNIGEYKRLFGLEDNPGGPFYAAIDKSNSLFTPGLFSEKIFRDDHTTTPEKIELGRRLFFERSLSSTGNRSCASCHDPSKAFTDGLRTSLALDGHSKLPRNAPTLWNAALQRRLFHDSRSRTLEEQVMQVLNNSLEMHGSAQEVAEMIITKPVYKELYQAAYKTSGTKGAAENICNAIASYERTLIALNSRFDRHMRGEKVLNEAEINGFNLFMGKAKCGTCHFMPLFSGAKPPRFYHIESEVIGVPGQNTKGSSLDRDSGRFHATGSPVHLFAFKTPTLRNIELTGPYMHNGVFNSLEEVLEFYNKGGGTGLGIAPPNQTLPPEHLNLSKKEIKDLVAFMRSLTDTIPRK